jgi:hypothetical protein
MVFASGEWKTRLIAGLRAFILSVLAFIAALVLHTLTLALTSTTHSSIFHAFSLVLDRAKARNFSTEGVPHPLGSQFFATVMAEWLQPAFKVIDGIPALSKFSILIVLLLICAVRVGRMTKLEVTIISFGFLGYASWYVVGYQHIMHHRMYDSYIFALTSGIAATLLLIVYFDQTVRFWLEKEKLIMSRFRQNALETHTHGELNMSLESARVENEVLALTGHK